MQGGGMPERFKGTVLKTVEALTGSESSNLSPSALHIESCPPEAGKKTVEPS